MKYNIIIMINIYKLDVIVYVILNYTIIYCIIQHGDVVQASQELTLLVYYFFFIVKKHLFLVFYS